MDQSFSSADGDSNSSGILLSLTKYLISGIRFILNIPFVFSFIDEDFALGDSSQSSSRSKAAQSSSSAKAIQSHKRNSM